METKDKQQVSEALSEKGIWVKVGLIPIYVKPITISQIYEMGAIANEINADNIRADEKINIMNSVIEHYEDADRMRKVFIVLAFRSKWKRWLLRRYIYKRLTMKQYMALLNHTAQSFDINFFLTSIIFLRKVVTVTEPR